MVYRNENGEYVLEEDTALTVEINGSVVFNEGDLAQLKARYDLPDKEWTERKLKEAIAEKEMADIEAIKFIYDDALGEFLGVRQRD